MATKNTKQTQGNKAKDFLLLLKEQGQSVHNLRNRASKSSSFYDEHKDLIEISLAMGATYQKAADILSAKIGKKIHNSGIRNYVLRNKIGPFGEDWESRREKLVAEVQKEMENV